MSGFSDARRKAEAAVEESKRVSARLAAGQNPYGAISGPIDPNQAFQGDQGASELMGQLTRAQWDDWKKRFSPYVDELIGAATDPNAGRDAATQARGAVRSSFNAAKGLQDSDRAAFGIQLTPEQRQSQDRVHGVTQAAAEVSAGNEARVAAQDRQRAIMAGGAGLSMIPDEVR